MNTKKIRYDLRMTQAEFARLVGVTQQRVSEWERGERRITANMAARIKQALKGLK